MIAPLVVGGTIQSRYRILETLGQGPMGSVFLAESMTTGTRVAVRIVPHELSMHAERSGLISRPPVIAGGQSKSPSVRTTAYEWEQLCDGRVLFATEYVNGRLLSALIREERVFDVDRALELGIQIAEAVEWAHNLGVVHQAIRPQNVVVSMSGADEHVRLLDWELTRLRSLCPLAMAPAEYLAPEQITGADITERTDIYAFGILLYEMLSGTVPFRAAVRDEVLRKQREESPVPLRRLRRDVPAAVERAVMQALQKAPEHRPRDIAALLNDLWMARTEWREARPSGTGRAWWAETKWQAIALGAVIAFGAALPGWVLLSHRSASTHSRPVVLAPMPSQAASISPLPLQGTAGGSARGGSGSESPDQMSSPPVPRQNNRAARTAAVLTGGAAAVDGAARGRAESKGTSSKPVNPPVGTPSPAAPRAVPVPAGAVAAGNDTAPGGKASKGTSSDESVPIMRRDATPDTESDPAGIIDWLFNEYRSQRP